MKEYIIKGCEKRDTGWTHINITPKGRSKLILLLDSNHERIDERILEMKIMKGRRLLIEVYEKYEEEFKNNHFVIDYIKRIYLEVKKGQYKQIMGEVGEYSDISSQQI